MRILRFLFDLILNSQSLNYKHCMVDSMENYLRDLGSERVKWRPLHCDIYYILKVCCFNCHYIFFFRDKLIPESMIRNIIYQVLQGLAFIHKHGKMGLLRVEG